MVVIQMDVHRRKYVVKMVVLHVRELLTQHPDVMVIDQRHRTDYVIVGLLPCGLYQFIADQIAKRFGAVRVSALANEIVKLRQKIRVNGHPNPAQFTHRYCQSNAL